MTCLIKKLPSFTSTNKLPANFFDRCSILAMQSEANMVCEMSLSNGDAHGHFTNRNIAWLSWVWTWYRGYAKHQWQFSTISVVRERLASVDRDLRTTLCPQKVYIWSLESGMISSSRGGCDRNPFKSGRGNVRMGRASCLRGGTLVMPNRDCFWVGVTDGTCWSTFATWTGHSSTIRSN